ncbi:major facilitator superfamily domain-containing protein [Fusarium tricinctum]|uniref:Major facilitator superfamily domain-containing protein n=1 Tax=Fusarium tricinctum TaxID=61284 RepID=A0A8K0S1A9_9HYPO|nr:major facilitator superfamily domain-containing protein [Fusarium tricinctum]
MLQPETEQDPIPTLRQRLETWIQDQIDYRNKFGNSLGNVNGDLSVENLSHDEKDGIVAERERLFSQRGILVTIFTVSLAAFLQGHVQSSINAISLFVKTVGIDIKKQGEARGNGANTTAQWQLGAMNAVPFFVAAFPGVLLSLPLNYCLGRRGSLALSALLIIASSVGSGFAITWRQILGARVVGGIAMGIRAFSAPILASETAVGYWRGSTILAWQLWVACGIMIGFVFNFVISAATATLDSSPDSSLDKHGSRYHALQWIAAAPAIPVLFLLVAVCFCYESPRFHMRPGTPNYDLERAYNILIQVRQTRLQATRDLFLIWWSTRVRHSRQGTIPSVAPHLSGRGGNSTANQRRTIMTLDSGLTYSSLVRLVMKLSADQFRPLFTRRRLRNALWSSCTVALAQQLCGINVFAFYSNGMFSEYGVKTSMGYSLGFGAVNYFFALPAMRSIDIIGRRSWLLSTIPFMSFFLMAATVAYALSPQQNDGDQSQPVANHGSSTDHQWYHLNISFPLENREAGASVAISINLLFAGLLTILLPRINAHFKMSGTLGFFAGLNIVAFILIFFFVEKTKQLTLEELEQVFDNPKSRFARDRLAKRLPSWVRTSLLGREDAERIVGDDEWVLENRSGGRSGQRSS